MFFPHSINSIRSFIYLAQPWWLECYFSLLYWPTQGVLFNCSFQWHITPLNPILFSTVTCYFAFLQYNAGNPATALVIAIGKGLTASSVCWKPVPMQIFLMKWVLSFFLACYSCNCSLASGPVSIILAAVQHYFQEISRVNMLLKHAKISRFLWVHVFFKVVSTV